MAKVGRNIKLLRTSRSMTQDDLAELLFVSRQTVSNYETGKSNPDIEMLVRIAEVLETDPNSLIYGSPDPQPRKKEWVRLAVAAGIFALLAAVVLIGGPAAQALAFRYLITVPLQLIQTILKPCMFLLAGWAIMQAIWLIFGINPLRKSYINWIHRIIIGMIAAYFVILGVLFIRNAYYVIIAFGGVETLGARFNLGPVWTWLVWKLYPFFVRYSAAFLILGIFLRATRPERAAAKQDADP